MPLGLGVAVNGGSLLGPPACAACVIEVNVRDENVPNL
jgi:hypothetical protein